jgi:DNA-binding MarR family transcriptional regulator
MVRAEAALDLDYVRLHTVLSRLYALLRKAAQSGDLSLTAASALRTLDQSGPRRLTDLASCEGVSQPAMTQLVGRLEREGYVGRSTDPTDGRVVLIHITPVGQELLIRRRDLTAARVKSLVHGLSPADAALIEAALPALERMADLEQTSEKSTVTRAES